MALEPSAGGHILIVEDYREVRESLAELLELEGYRVAVAANGQEALDHLLGGQLPRLILLDLMMPVMNGWEFRRRQKRDPSLASVPVVAVTGAVELAEPAVSIDAVGYLGKPVDVGMLLDLVKLHCQ
jgi:CheY-like chemotaxis protein